MSEGILGHGTTLVGSVSGAVGNIVGVGGGGRIRDAVDKSTVESTDKFKEYFAGMADEGELTVELNYDGSDTGVGNLLNIAYQNGAEETWTVTLSDLSSFACLGFINNLGVPSFGSPGEKVSQSVSIKLSGKGTFTDVAPA